MAGDWIKFETATLEKPEVCQIADAADIDLDAAVGKLLRVWVWFDQQSEDGNAPSVSKKLLDRLVGVTGFCGLMESVGWMTNVDGVISLPNFERHNGKTAKNRALTAKRVANHKVKTNADGNGAGVSDALPREEKRREDQKPLKAVRAKKQKDSEELVTFEQLVGMGCDPEHARDWLQVRKKKKSDLTPTAWKGVEREAAKAGISVAMAVQISAERGWIGFKSDWDWRSGNDRSANGQTNTGTRGASRPSLVDRVIQANAHLFDDEQPPVVDARDWPEFDSIREVDGHLVGPDD